MLRHKIYYALKPLIPQGLRMGLRRQLAARTRRRVSDVWPIMPGSERAPLGWPGWPEGKKFAVVLTHDVEGRTGVEKCEQLMHLEMEHGFRSCFNLIPEGTYRVPRQLREELVRNGFEIGVHDLNHDGRLYRSRREFSKKARKINYYLKEWGAVGFRSAFMLNNLEWLHDLEIAYDMSTFDTDPFEPQPEGRHTIFPFWVPAPATQKSEVGSQRSEDRGRAFVKATPKGISEKAATQWEDGSQKEEPSVLNSRSGYMELPYTLVQDSTLFLFLREPSIDLWRRKVDWIVEHGGMVHLDTHPDYMSMSNTSGSTEVYPVSFYTELLPYIQSKYAGLYWHALPREVAARTRMAERATNTPVPQAPVRSRSLAKVKPKIWIDLDNTPHVPFFEPIVEELKSRGFPLLLTARNAFQVCELADKKGLQYSKIGRHNGKNALLKGAGLVYRSLQLAPTVLREKPLLGVSHGARSQLLLSNWLRIPTILIDDYEHCDFPIMMRPSWVIAPTVIPDSAFPVTYGRIRKYHGIKEDAYAWKLKPDTHLLRELGLATSDLIVTVRPPATEAHYHNPESERLFERFMERACRTAGVRVVLIPRNQKQGSQIRQRWPDWFKNGCIVIPHGAVDGLNLIWHSDLVVSGGGTMNREAAALGVPVYSIFRGTIGAVDHHLENQGRLILVESLADVETKIRLEKRPARVIAEATSKSTLLEIVDGIKQIAEFYERVA